MKLATGWKWLASLSVVLAILALSGAGCSSPADKTDKTKTKTTAKTTAKTTPKPSDKTDAKTDTPAETKTAAKTDVPEKTQEPKKTEEEPKVEEPKKTEEEPKVEEPKKTEEEPKVEEPKKTEEPKVEEPKMTEEPKVEEPKKTEEPKVEEPKKTEEEPKVEEPKKTEEPAKETTPAAPAAVEITPEKVSSYASAEDLTTQMDDFLKTLAKAVETADTFKDESGNLVKDAHTMAVLALALGLHDQDSKYKAAAPAVLKAAQALAEVKDYEGAKKAATDLVAALESKETAQLKWEKVASLPELMKQVPNLHTKLKMKITGTRLKSQAKASQAHVAAIAAIAQASVVDTSEAKTPDEVKQWQTFCAEMREASAAVNAAIRQQDRAALTEAMNGLQKSCDDCHKVFHQAALTKQAEEKKE